MALAMTIFVFLSGCALLLGTYALVRGWRAADALERPAVLDELWYEDPVTPPAQRGEDSETDADELRV